MDTAGFFTRALNKIGIHTRAQHEEAQAKIDSLIGYSDRLEGLLKGDTDPRNPVLIFGENVSINHLTLQPNQRLVVGRLAKQIDIGSIFVAPPARPEDKGPWRAANLAEKCVYRTFIESADSNHDVRLYVTGDFENDEQRLAYAEEIAKRLNAQTARASIASEVSQDARRFRWLLDDHAEPETRTAVRALLIRMGTRSLSGARLDIDGAMKSLGADMPADEVGAENAPALPDDAMVRRAVNAMWTVQPQSIRWHNEACQTMREVLKAALEVKP